MSETARIAIISDTHGQLHPQIDGLIRECDIAIHAGDICEGDVLRAMQPKTGQVVSVRGNNDDERLWPTHQLSQLGTLPWEARLEAPGGIIKIEHGHRHDMICPDHADLRNAHPEARLVVYGHTHRKVIDDSVQPWVVNPGAAGATRTRGGASCLVLIADRISWKFESYRFSDIEHVGVSAA